MDRNTKAVKSELSFYLYCLTPFIYFKSPIVRPVKFPTLALYGEPGAD
jgi:hypothetical protein